MIVVGFSFQGMESNCFKFSTIVAIVGREGWKMAGRGRVGFCGFLYFIELGLGTDVNIKDSKRIAQSVMWYLGQHLMYETSD